MVESIKRNKTRTTTHSRPVTGGARFPQNSRGPVNGAGNANYPKKKNDKERYAKRHLNQRAKRKLRRSSLISSTMSVASSVHEIHEPRRKDKSRPRVPPNTPQPPPPPPPPVINNNTLIVIVTEPEDPLPAIEGRKPIELVDASTQVEQPKRMLRDGHTLTFGLSEMIDKIAKAEPYIGVPEDKNFMITKRKWYHLTTKYEYHSDKPINTEHEIIKNKDIPLDIINEELFVYLISNMQTTYPDRKTKIAHAHKLKIKYYDLPGHKAPINLNLAKIDMLTVSRATDEKESLLLYGEHPVYRKRGFRNALLSPFRSIVTTFYNH